MKEDLIYRELSYLVNGICFKVHNQLGRFCREKQYADTLEVLLKGTPLVYKREYEVPFKVDGQLIKGNRVDFLIEDKLLLELKAKPLVTKGDYFQMQRYLAATGYKLGFLVNFHQVYLKPKRILNPNVNP